MRLIERSAEPFAQAASAYAGAMLAPYCEVEAAEPVVRDLGLRSLAIWRATYPGVTVKGTLVVAGTRDRADLVRFARMTEGFDKLDAEQLDALEPGLEGRFAAGLYYAQEAHMAPAASHGLSPRRGEALRASTWPSARLGQGAGPASETIIDCRGLGARDELARPARRARRAHHRAHARDRACTAPCGSCTRATRSTSCRGATASSWSAPP